MTGAVGVSVQPAVVEGGGPGGGPARDLCLSSTLTATLNPALKVRKKNIFGCNKVVLRWFTNLHYTPSLSLSLSYSLSCSLLLAHYIPPSLPLSLPTLHVPQAPHGQLE